MKNYQIVVDTNVVISGVRSKDGASALLLERIGQANFTLNISIQLFLEYEEKLHEKTNLEKDEIEKLLAFIFGHATIYESVTRRRPLLSDADDEMIAELALEAKCDAIVTYNKRHFKEIEKFGIEVLNAKECLQQIGVIT
ncbi:MAG: putative toxin-antitoxin system toxin component, PIN family [Rhizobacter sp.]|nr:putative toxin-antitoxin system toxin component, PIN family [Chlorobiales bacterium]